VIASYEHSSLFGLVIRKEGKTFYNIGTWLMMEQRTGASGKALRIEVAVYCHREGKSDMGCPIAKEIIKRSSLEEKFLVAMS
jgi:hypothetical protein